MRGNKPKRQSPYVTTQRSVNLRRITEAANRPVIAAYENITTLCIMIV